MSAIVNRTGKSRTTSRSRRAGWVAVTLLATLVSLVSVPYLTLDPETFLDEQRLVYLANQGPLFLHVAGGVVALIVGPWQFVQRLRGRYPALHRIMGRVYLVSVLATGVGGLLLAPHSYTGPVAGSAFAVLALLMLGTSAAALHTIQRRRVARHRVWMTRSYALIWTAVTFRLWLGLAPALTGLSFEQAYPIGAWVSWMINLIVAEILISRPARRKRRPSDSPPVSVS